MINWFKYPFIRLLMPFMLGIWLSFTYLNLSKNEVKLLLITVVFLGIVVFVIASAVKNYQYRWLFGVLLNLHLILIGVAIVHIRNDDLESDSDVWVARLTENPAEKEKSVKVILEMQSDVGLVMAYLEKNERSLSLRYGDVIVFHERPKLVEPPMNPEQFDYKKYLARKGISYQAYLKNDSWEKLQNNGPSFVR